MHRELKPFFAEIGTHHSRQPKDMKDNKCTGWWEQWGKREEMEALRIYLGEGKINGSGIDYVGTFTFSGVVSDENHVRMTKVYLGKHSVEYIGQYNGSNRLQGVWKLMGMQGPWEIVIHSEKKEEEQSVLEAKSEALSSFD